MPNPYLSLLKERVEIIEDKLTAALRATENAIRDIERLPQDTTPDKFPPYALASAQSTWVYIAREQITEALEAINGKKQ